MAVGATIAALVVASLRLAEPTENEGAPAEQPEPLGVPNAPDTVEPSVPPPEAAPAEHEDLLPRSELPPWQRDPAAGAFAGVGSVAAALGVGLVVGAHLHQRNAPGVANEDAFADHVGTARRMHIAGWSTLAVGCTLLVAAALRWGVLAREQRARDPDAKRRRR